MDIFENKFKIIPIVKSTDDDYKKALQIYMKETPKEIRTNTNEISHWIDKKVIDPTFEILAFKLYLDSKLIGFALITYIQCQQIVLLDYMSLNEPYRVNSIFLVFLNMIQNYIISINKQVTYYIAEINNKDNGRNIDRESAFYKRVICLENFGEVKNKYYNIPLGIDNLESEFESLMFIKTNDRLQYISKDTFLAIAYAICYKYYYVWYSDFLNSEEKRRYKEILDKTYNDIKKNITGELIKIQYPICPLFQGESYEKTLNKPKKKILIKFPILILILLSIPLIISLFYSFVFSYFNLKFDKISTFVSGLIGTCVTVYLGYFIGKKNH